MAIKLFDRQLLEESILHQIILENVNFEILIESTFDSHGLSKRNRIIYDVMVELFINNIPIDLVTLFSSLNEAQSIKTIGGVDYLCRIADLDASHNMYSIIGVKRLIKLLEDY